MRIIEVADWKILEEKVAELHGELLADTKASSLLFRGQRNSEWSLATTLERAGCEGMLFSQYYQLMCRIRPAVETFTGVEWQLPEYAVVENLAQDFSLGLDNFPSLDTYRHMVYLRHHGFPSPLLDWSYSPWVAAFFAFRDPSPVNGTRSIYAFCEMPHGHKVTSGHAPRIRPIGPYVRSHSRHFRQQSDYTICGRFDHAWRFHPHEGALDDGRPDQDYLCRFDLPSSERVRVLGRLNDFNLNAFSLFDSEEALLETMWLREYVLKP